MIVTQILGGLLTLLGIYLILAKALGGPGTVQIPGIAVNVPSSVLVLLVGVAVFLFPLSPWWPTQLVTTTTTEPATTAPGPESTSTSLDKESTTSSSPDEETTTSTSLDEEETTSTVPQCERITDAVTPTPIQIWALDVLKGDKEFNSHGPDVFGEVRTLWESGDSIELQVYLQAIETQADWTQASGTSGWTTIYTASSGWRIYSVTAAGEAVPVEGRGSDAADFGTSDGRGGIVDPNVDDRGEPSAATVIYRDTNHSADIRLGSGIVREWRFIGDTDGDDVGRSNGDDDANVTVTFNLVSVELIEAGDCAP